MSSTSKPSGAIWAAVGAGAGAEIRDMRRRKRGIGIDGYLPLSAPWLETFENEIVSFPMSKFADQVDSMVHFLGFLDVRSRWTIDVTAYRYHRERPF